MAKSKGTVNSKQLFDLDEIKKAGIVLRSLNHKTRQTMLHLLDTNQEMMVTEIYKKLKIEQSRASAYLALMRKAGVVTTRRDGQIIYYAVDYKRLAEVEKGAKMITG